MNEKQLRSILRNLTEQQAPKETINLWPAIETRFQTSDLPEPKGPEMNTRQKRIPKLAAAITLAVVLIGVLFFSTPQGQAMAQSLLQFFTRAESNELPLQSFQLTPLPTPGTPTPNPASIIDANPEIAEVELQAGYDVFEPSWIPSNLTFVGASIEDQKIVRIFYQYEYTNGLAFRQEPLPTSENCELCDMVGPDASVEQVAIGTTTGEYVEGVWKLTDQGPLWESDPWLKTLRWQMDGMAYELQYMGPPETLSMEDMIAIAESVK